MKKINGLILSLVFLGWISGCATSPETKPEATAAAPTAPVAAASATPSEVKPAETPAPVATNAEATPTPEKPKPAPKKKGKKMLVIETTHGTIEVELFPKEAPKTVARISELAKKGFYNGLSFHRVVPGFVAQGGDPKGDGTGGSGQNLPAEFNWRKHVEGAVAMARAQDPNSADSQFYISLGTHPHLDNNYTVFGQVVKGMEAAKKIAIGDKMTKVTVK